MQIHTNPLTTIKNEKITINTSINYLFILYAFFLPTSKAGVNFAEILIILLWIYDSNWKDKIIAYKTNFIILTFALFIGYNILSLLWADNLSFAIAYIEKYRHFLIIPAIYTYINKKFIQAFLNSFLTGMLISELFSYGIFFEIITYKNKLPSDPSPFMDHISYSVFLSFTAIILLNRIFFNPSIKYKLFQIIFFITVTTNLFLNGGRTGQVTFIVTLATLYFLNIKHKIIALFGIIITLGIILTLSYNFNPNFISRMAQTNIDIKNMLYNDTYNGSISNRVALWYIGIDEILDQKYIIGAGIGNDTSKMEYYADKNKFKYSDIKQGDHHNMFITYFIQLGLFGFILISLLFYFIFKLDIKNKVYRNLNITFAITFLLWSFTGMNFHGMNPMTLFAFFIGLFNSISRYEDIKISS